MDEGRQSPGLGWNKHSCIISASLQLLPPYILSTSIKSNSLLAAHPVISHGWASGSHATCILLNAAPTTAGAAVIITSPHTTAFMSYPTSKALYFKR